MSNRRKQDQQPKPKKLGMRYAVLPAGASVDAKLSALAKRLGSTLPAADSSYRLRDIPAGWRCPGQAELDLFSDEEES